MGFHCQIPLEAWPAGNPERANLDSAEVALPFASWRYWRLRKRRAREKFLMAQAPLAHSNRLARLLEISASTAREVNQPLAAITANAEASLRLLTRPKPDVREAIEAIKAIVSDVERASRVIQSIYALAVSTQPDMSTPDVNGEVVAPTEREARKRDAAHPKKSVSPPWTEKEKWK